MTMRFGEGRYSSSLHETTARSCVPGFAHGMTKISGVIPRMFVGQNDKRHKSVYLFHFLFGAVTVAGDHLVLDLLLVLVLHFEWPTGFVYDLDLQFAPGAILFRIRWVICQCVLVPDRRVDVMENLGQFAFEAREPGMPTGQASEGVHLIIGL